MAEKLVKFNLQLPASLVARLDQLVWDPVRNRPQHGARTAIIRTLLERHLQEQENDRTDPPSHPFGPHGAGGV